MLALRFTQISAPLLFLVSFNPVHAMETPFVSKTNTVSLVTDKRPMLTAREYFALHARAIKDQSKEIDTLHQQLKKKRIKTFFTAWRCNVYKKVADSRKAKCTKLIADHAVEVQRIRQTHEQQLQQEQTLSAANQDQLNQIHVTYNATLAQLQQSQAAAAQITAALAEQQRQARVQQENVQGQLHQTQVTLDQTTASSRVQLQQEQVRCAAIQEQLNQKQAAYNSKLQELQQSQATVANITATLAEQQRQGRIQHENLQGQVRQTQATLDQTTASSRVQLQQEQVRCAVIQEQLNQKQAAYNSTLAQLQQSQGRSQTLEVSMNHFRNKFNNLKSAIANHIRFYRAEIASDPTRLRNYKRPDGKLPLNYLFLLREELCVGLRLLKSCAPGLRLNYDQELTPLFESPESYLTRLVENA